MGKSTEFVKRKMKDDFKPLVYICAPYRGNIEQNIFNATQYARYVFDKGNIPVTPHLLFPFLDEKKHRNEAMKMDLVLLGKCQELWVFGNRITEGMKKEIDLAKRRQQPIKYFLELPVKDD